MKEWNDVGLKQGLEHFTEWTTKVKLEIKEAREIGTIFFKVKVENDAKNEIVTKSKIR